MLSILNEIHMTLIVLQKSNHNHRPQLSSLIAGRETFHGMMSEAAIMCVRITGALYIVQYAACKVQQQGRLPA